MKTRLLHIQTLLVALCLFACKEQPYSTNFDVISKDSKAGISLIEHPYIFKEQKLKLDSLYFFKSQKNIIMRAVVSGQIDRINDQSFFYIHGFNTFQDTIFTNLDLRLKTKTNNDFIIFERALKESGYKFSYIEIGLASHNSDKRFMTLSLDSITISRP